MPQLRESNAPCVEKIQKFASEQVAFGMRYGADYIAQLYRAQLSYHSPDFYAEDRGVVGGMIELIHEGQACGQLRDTLHREPISVRLYGEQMERDNKK